MSAPDGWKDFVNALVAERGWEQNSTTEKLARLVGDDDLDKVIWACLRSQAVDWLYKEVPVIDYKRPIDLLATEAGREELKRLMMSNPWW